MRHRKSGCLRADRRIIAESVRKLKKGDWQQQKKIRTNCSFGLEGGINPLSISSVCFSRLHSRRPIARCRPGSLFIQKRHSRSKSSKYLLVNLVVYRGWVVGLSHPKAEHTKPKSVLAQQLVSKEHEKSSRLWPGFASMSKHFIVLPMKDGPSSVLAPSSDARSP